MIYLLTGTPGHGKTQRAIWLLLNDKRFKGRPVYYANVRGLKASDERISHWQPLEDVTKWNELPPGSIVFYDEAQQAFPIRGVKAPPKWIEDLATHRHLGLDFVLVTQNAKNIDHFVRRLVELHIHCKRPAQMGFTNVYEFQGVTDCDNNVPVDKALRHERWKLDKTIWTLYESADEHTSKAKLPRILFAIPLLVIAFGAALFFVVSRFSSADASKLTDAGSKSHTKNEKSDSKKQRSASNQPTASEVTSTASLSPLDLVKRQMTETKQWQLDRVPRQRGYPESAPLYDDVRELKTFPIIAACAKKADDCRCFNQQGIREQVDLLVCMEFVAVGRFNPYKDEKREREAESRRSEPRSQHAREQQQPYLVQGLSGHWFTETRPTGYSVSAGGDFLHLAKPGQSEPSPNKQGGSGGNGLTASTPQQR